MRFTRLELENWRNFRAANVQLQERTFVVGPNASGKSNLLDVFRFLRDIAEPEGGFQRAVKSRGGVSNLRCLHARKQPDVVVDVEVEIEQDRWSYRLQFSQDKARRPLVTKEVVKRNGELILQRPDRSDDSDPNRMTQTHLEQVNANKEFRVLAEFLAHVRYLHIVPQLVRESDRFRSIAEDPYGSDFLERIAKTQERTLKSRLKRINAALQVAVPQLQELRVERDERGAPHLKGLYKHWRPNAGWQTEEQFSDGTLRLLGLLWAVLDGNAPLILEEPELSLHSAVVRFIPAMMFRATRKTARQTIISTHSADLLTEESIAPEEVLLLHPSEDGTRIEVAADNEQVRALLDGSVPLAEIVFPQTAPENASQLSLFGD